MEIKKKHYVESKLTRAKSGLLREAMEGDLGHCLRDKSNVTVLSWKEYTKEYTKDILGYKERTLDRNVDTLKTEKVMVLREHLKMSSVEAFERWGLLGGIRSLRAHTGRVCVPNPVVSCFLVTRRWVASLCYALLLLRWWSKWQQANTDEKENCIQKQKDKSIFLVLTLLKRKM